MKTVYSKDNKFYKRYKELSGRKYREKYGLYLIEGERLIDEALKNGAELESVLFGEEQLFERKSLEAWAERIEESGAAEAVCLGGGLFKELSQTINSQGVLAAVRLPDRLSAEEFTAYCGAHRNMAIADRLQDPGNMGTLIRTADAAGYGGMIVISGSTDPFSPKAVRAAAGSIFRLPIYFAKKPEEAARLARESGRRLFAAAADGEKAYFEAELSKDAALIIGNEGGGVSRELMETADERIYIPMRGNTESLNASAAAAILMYETIRKGE